MTKEEKDEYEKLTGKKAEDKPVSVYVGRTVLDGSNEFRGYRLPGKRKCKLCGIKTPFIKGMPYCSFECKDKNRKELAFPKELRVCQACKKESPMIYNQIYCSTACGYTKRELPKLCGTTEIADGVRGVCNGCKVYKNIKGQQYCSEECVRYERQRNVNESMEEWRVRGVDN